MVEVVAETPPVPPVVAVPPCPPLPPVPVELVPGVVGELPHAPAVSAAAPSAIQVIVGEIVLRMSGGGYACNHGRRERRYPRRMPRPLLVAALLALAGCGQTVIVPPGSNTTSGAGGATTSSATGGGVAGGGGTICSPHTCEGLGFECGAVFDGCLGTIECGACPAGQSCGAGGVPGKCGGAECGPGSCCPVTCAQHGAECGVVGDGCGGVLDCGTCPAGKACDAGLCL